MKIYIPHYSKLIERKKHLIEQFERQNITNYEFIEKYDKEYITDNDMSIFTYDPSTPKAVISLSLKNFYIYQQIRDHDEYALVMEDDVILCDNFMDTLKGYMNQLPTTYDMVFIGDGMGFHIQPELIIPNTNIYKKDNFPTSWGGDGCTRCTDCYLISKECAIKMYSYMYEKNVKSNPSIDMIINRAARHMNFEVYWAEPTLVSNGSITKVFKSAIFGRSWVLVFFANEPYINKAFTSIHFARKTGKWKDDIVLLVPGTLIKNEEVIKHAQRYDVKLVEIPNLNFSNIIEHWKKFSDHKSYKYVIEREFIFNKFFAFDVFFRKWDVVFYLDAGSSIHGSLDRMKQCDPVNCIYAHSDTHPTYEKKFNNLFDLNMISTDKILQMISTYDFTSDYFQSTLMIYDTNIIEDNTVKRLVELANMYPNATTLDQGILNLYFNSERKLWKQIPLEDEKGFLYDYHERAGYRGRDYIILKLIKEGF
jgi:GR25 family glycosyltransferase involved in LPS biosynthesis